MSVYSRWLVLFSLSLALFLGACSDTSAPPPLAKNTDTGSDKAPDVPEGSDSDVVDPVASDDDDNVDSAVPGDSAEDPATGDDTETDTGDDSDVIYVPVACTEGNAEKVCGAEGFCVDGFCCDGPCTGSCEVCNAAGSEGVCSPAPVETVCREAAGGCDVAEMCDGASRFCPPNKVALAGTVCREAQGECEVDVMCDGKTLDCPEDIYADTDVDCGEIDACTQGGKCDGAGGCIPIYQEPGFACGDDGDSLCDKPDTCDGAGNCLANFVASGTECTEHPGNPCFSVGQCNDTGQCVGYGFRGEGALCGDETETTCDKPDTCDASGVCQPNYVAASSLTECSDAAGPCKLPGYCDGSGGCASAANKPDNTPCGSYNSEDPCDAQDVCVAGVCEVRFAPSNKTCASSDQCTLGGRCDGQGVCEMSYRPSGFGCGDRNRTPCDEPDSCDGSGNCLPNFLAAGDACSADPNNTCLAMGECDGAGQCLGNVQKAEGAACGSQDDWACDKPDTCDANGVCQPNYVSAESQTVCSDPVNSCKQPGYCDGAGKCASAANKPDNTPCGSYDPGNVCDAQDVCLGGLCQPRYAPSSTDCGEISDCINGGKCNGAGGCNLIYRSPGTFCGDQTDSLCDKRDTCDNKGVCQPNYVALGTPCSADPTNECLKAGACNGTGACVGNDFKMEHTPCGDQGDSLCDKPDTCDANGVCQANYVAQGTSCTSDPGNECLSVGSCNATGACVGNVFKAENTPCGDQGDSLCDKPDTCNANGVCQANYVAQGTSCTSDPGNECLSVGSCNATGACVGNVFKAEHTPCGDSGEWECDHADTCDANGVCQPNYEPLANQTECATPGNDCQKPGLCDGAGGCASQGPKADGASCGDATMNTDCDKPDTCLLGECEPNYVALNTSCNTGKNLGDCETGDTCDGVGQCLVRYVSSGTLCRAAVPGGCDVAEYCTGSEVNCPTDQFEPATKVCRAAVPGGCDIEERCTGTSAECPTDKYEALGKVCRAKDGECDVAEVCTGTSATCPADVYAPASQVCGTTVTEYRCSDDACGAQAQTRILQSHCAGSSIGKTCVADATPDWSTLATCNATAEVCRATTTSAGCVACDDNFAPADYCGTGDDEDVLFYYAGAAGTCENNQCVGYTPLEEDCEVGCQNGACIALACPSGGVEHAGYCWHKAKDDKTNCIETCNSKGDGEGGILYYDEATRTYAGTVTAGSTANMANCGLVTEALGKGNNPSGIQTGKGTGCTLHGGQTPYFVSNLVTTGWEVTDYHHRVCACRRGVAEEEHCLNGWHSTTQGAACTSQTQGDRAVCKFILDCLIENNCPSVAACVNVNGNSTCLKKSEGTAYQSYVNNVWAAMCQ